MALSATLSRLTGDLDDPYPTLARPTLLTSAASLLDKVRASPVALYLKRAIHLQPREASESLIRCSRHYCDKGRSSFCHDQTSRQWPILGCFAPAILLRSAPET